MSETVTIICDECNEQKTVPDAQQKELNPRYCTECVSKQIVAARKEGLRQ